MFKLLDSQDLLEHLIQLFFAEDEFGYSAEGHASLLPPLVLFSFVYGIVFSDPGAEDSLFAQAVDLGQAAHATLDVLLEYLTEVTGRTASALYHARHSLAFQEALMEETVTRSIHRYTMINTSKFYFYYFLLIKLEVQFIHIMNALEHIFYMKKVFSISELIYIYTHTHIYEELFSKTL